MTDPSERAVSTPELLEFFQQVMSERTAVAIAERLEDLGAHRVQEAQLAALQALAERIQAPAQGMDPDQSRIEVRFRALQASLGGASRGASPQAPVLMTSPRLYHDGRLEFVDVLPDRAWTVVLTVREKRPDRSVVQVDRRRPVSDVSPDALVLDGAGDVQSVEFRDLQDRTLQFGIPLRVTAVSRSAQRRN